MTAPRPMDPDVLWGLFVRHQQTCTVCVDGQLCPYGEHLSDAWYDSDLYHANEQDMIDAVTNEEKSNG